MVSNASWTYRKPALIGLAAAFILVGGVGAWATQVQIAGAVVGHGRIEADTEKQVIQHPHGGVVAEVLVSDGDRVGPGDVVLRFEGFALHSQLNTIEGELAEVLARGARLEAEVDDETELRIGNALAERAGSDPATRLAIARQERLLREGLAALDQELGLIRKKITQIEKQIVAVEAQIAAKRDQVSLVENDLVNAESLNSRQLIKLSDVSSLRRDRARLIGEAGSLAANRAELDEKIVEMQLQLVSLPVKRRRTAMEELSKLQPDKVKLIEKRAELMEEIDKLDVRTPLAGTIHDSQIRGPRGVVLQGTPIMYVVPSDRPAVAVVRVDAGDIDQLRVGQDTALRFSAFNRRATPLVEGRVVGLSADAFIDQKTLGYYYEARIAFSRADLHGIDGDLLVPGMPVEAFFATEEQTPFNYVTKPLVDYFNRAYRDT